MRIPTSLLTFLLNYPLRDLWDNGEVGFLAGFLSLFDLDRGREEATVRVEATASPWTPLPYHTHVASAVSISGH